jgi:Protein phosphatase 2C
MVQVAAGAFATAGMRGEDAMEDRNIVSTELGCAQERTLLAVFDGHRGPQAAEYAAQHFESTLLRHWAGAGSVAKALTAAFLQVDADFQRWHAGATGWHGPVCTLALYHCTRIDTWGQGKRRTGVLLEPWMCEHGPCAHRRCSVAGPQRWAGCTALVSLVCGDRLYVANAGDCRAVLCRGREAVMALYRCLSSEQGSAAADHPMIPQSASRSRICTAVHSCTQNSLQGCRCRCRVTTRRSWTASGSGSSTRGAPCPASAACGVSATSASWSPGEPDSTAVARTEVVT